MLRCNSDGEDGAEIVANLRYVLDAEDSLAVERSTLPSHDFRRGVFGHPHRSLARLSSLLHGGLSGSIGHLALV